jgi:hypothetical protein
MPPGVFTFDTFICTADAGGREYLLQEPETQLFEVIR